MAVLPTNTIAHCGSEAGFGLAKNQMPLLLAGTSKNDRQAEAVVVLQLRPKLLVDLDREDYAVSLTRASVNLDADWYKSRTNQTRPCSGRHKKDKSTFVLG